MKAMFRTLRADEIEVRAARCNEKGAQLLLYKDARCDMNILDDTVGAENWQRRHDEHNDNLFCSVGIRINNDWIFKEDAGAESNTEAEKGHASDSFKRACVNWGIGRELYTSPFIWIPGCTENKNGKWVTNEKFFVSSIAYDENRRISALELSTDKLGVVFSYPRGKKKDEEPKPIESIKFICTECGNLIKPFKHNGEEVPTRAVYERTITKYGRPLCKECAKKMDNTPVTQPIERK